VAVVDVSRGRCCIQLCPTDRGTWRRECVLGVGLTLLCTRTAACEAALARRDNMVEGRRWGAKPVLHRSTTARSTRSDPAHERNSARDPLVPTEPPTLLGDRQARSEASPTVLSLTFRQRTRGGRCVRRVHQPNRRPLRSLATAQSDKKIGWNLQLSEARGDSQGQGNQSERSIIIIQTKSTASKSRQHAASYTCRCERYFVADCFDFAVLPN
jgi:hypothetical protein